MKKVYLALLGCLFLLAAAVSQPVTIAAQDAKTELLLMLSGNFPGALERGEESRFYLTVKNNGDSDISNITFSHDAPQGLQVSFSPDSIASLTPGSSTTVDVVLKVDSGSTEGDYSVNLVADSNQVRSVTSLYVRVEGGRSVWAWVGLGIGLVVVLAFVLIYLRWGKS